MLFEEAGLNIDPSVSVPMLAHAKPNLRIISSEYLQSTQSMMREYKAGDWLTKLQ